MLQAYTSQFRQKSTTFVMACSIVGMMEAVARLTPVKRAEWQRTWWVRAAAAAATPQRHTQLARHSRRGAAGTTEPVRHSRCGNHLAHVLDNEMPNACWCSEGSQPRQPRSPFLIPPSHAGKVMRSRTIHFLASRVPGTDS